MIISDNNIITLLFWLGISTAIVLIIILDGIFQATLKQVLTQLQGKQKPILLQSMNRCTIYQNQLYRLVKVDCLIK